MLATCFQTLAGDARHIVGVAPAPHTRRDAWLAPAAIRARNAGGMSEFGDTVDRNDIDRFAAHSAAWWDPEGIFRPLHRINPARLDFIRRQLLASFGRDAKGLRLFEGLRLIDIGCGGGLVPEPMTRLGFAVTGIDADASAIEVAHAHAEASGSTSPSRSKSSSTSPIVTPSSPRWERWSGRVGHLSARPSTARHSPLRWRLSAPNIYWAGCRAAPMTGGAS